MSLPRRAFLDDPILPVMAAFLLERWKERAAERGETEPDDLGNACIFCSVFAREVFGGEIRGSEPHFHLRTTERLIVDLCRDSLQTRTLTLRQDAYLHDRRFMRSAVVREQIDSCLPRVRGWLDLWEPARCAA